MSGLRLPEQKQFIAKVHAYNTRTEPLPLHLQWSVSVANLKFWNRLLQKRRPNLLSEDFRSHQRWHQFVMSTDARPLQRWWRGIIL